MAQKNLNLALLVLGLVVLGVLSRLSVHAWNFTILGGLALFSGALFVRKWVSILVMFTTLILSDILIGFHGQMPLVYLAFFMLCALGIILSNRPSRALVLGTSVLGSLLFFVVTNFAVWFEGALYPQTLSGLIECYMMGIPFYQNQILGDVISTFILFEVARAARGFLATRFGMQQLNQI